jgi:hypothetical protein
MKSEAGLPYGTAYCIRWRRTGYDGRFIEMWCPFLESDCEWVDGEWVDGAWLQIGWQDVEYIDGEGLEVLQDTTMADLGLFGCKYLGYPPTTSTYRD